MGLHIFVGDGFDDLDGNRVLFVSSVVWMFGSQEALHDSYCFKAKHTEALIG